MCSKSTIKTPEWGQWLLVSIVNCEHISHFFNVSIIDFEQPNVSRDCS